MTLELKEFLEDLQYVYNYSEKTVDSYRRDIEKFYDFFLSEGSTIEEVDNIIIRNFLNKELEELEKSYNFYIEEAHAISNKIMFLKRIISEINA